MLVRWQGEMIQLQMLMGHDRRSGRRLPSASPYDPSLTPKLQCLRFLCLSWNHFVRTGPKSLCFGRLSLQNTIITLTSNGTPSHRCSGIPSEAFSVRSEVFGRFFVQRIGCIGLEEQELRSRDQYRTVHF